MPTGLRPRVNEAREFLEIAKDFKDPKEILREAISNSWDAGATKITLKFDLSPIPGSRGKKVNVTIQDDGSGMSSQIRPEVGSSEIEGFFNLGDSGKDENQIGSKGHGTTIYYKSAGIIVTTFSGDKKIEARTDVNLGSPLNLDKSLHSVGTKRMRLEKVPELKSMLSRLSRKNFLNYKK